jgi:pimeloyl-ACP methyl ester carboxylesterase
MPDQGEIYFHTAGAGPELLMVHGGLPADFESLMEILSPAHHCIAFDRLGFGRSARLARNSTVDEQVAAIAAVHGSVTSTPAWVFGYSSGGNFALAYALAHPDRVSGLVLVEPALYAIYPPDKLPPEVERLHSVVMPLFQQGQVEQGWHAFIATVFPGLTWSPLSADVLDDIRSFSYDLQKAITWFPSLAELRRLTRPALLLEGDRSPPLLRDICQRLNRHLSHSRLVTLAGQDHGMPFAAPIVVAEQMMEFMSEWAGGVNPLL